MDEELTKAMHSAQFATQELQAARYRLSVFIGTATVDAHIAVRRGFRVARERLLP